MVSLDDPKTWTRFDGHGMLKVLETYVDDFATAFRAASTLRLRPPKRMTHVVVTGMGGSGITGTLAQDLVRPEAPVPVATFKDYTLPAYVGKETVVIAVSYSGQTEETLSCAEEALRRGAYVVGISSGGRLKELTSTGNAFHVPVPPGRQPRVALPHLLGALTGTLHALGVAKLEFDPPAANAAKAAQATLLPQSPEAQNPAKQFARALHDKFPVWYTSYPLAAVGLRGRCQLNENAKKIARNDVLPEGNHNDLVSWSQMQRPEKYFVGLLRQPDEAPPIRTRFEFFEAILKRKKVTHLSYVVRSPTRLGRVLEGLIFVDYVSVYTAFMRGTDPTPVEIIDELKQLLAKNGKPPVVERRVS